MCCNQSLHLKVRPTDLYQKVLLCICPNQDTQTQLLQVKIINMSIQVSHAHGASCHYKLFPLVNESKDIPKQIRDNWGKVENVTSLSSQDKPHFGVQSRVIKTVTTIPADTDAHASCTVLCDRPPIPPSWMFSPEEYSTNSKYRQAKVRNFLKDAFYSLKCIGKCHYEIQKNGTFFKKAEISFSIFT